MVIPHNWEDIWSLRVRHNRGFGITSVNHLWPLYSTSNPPGTFLHFWILTNEGFWDRRTICGKGSFSRVLETFSARIVVAILKRIPRYHESISRSWVPHKVIKLAALAQVLITLRLTLGSVDSPEHPEHPEHDLPHRYVFDFSLFKLITLNLISVLLHHFCQVLTTMLKEPKVDIF
jgi:hypothetical protein